MTQRIATVLAAAMLIPALHAAIVKGTVADETGEALPQATVKLLTARDSTYIGGTTTNNDGRFTLSDIKRGRYILAVSYLGYDTHSEPVNVNAEQVTIPAIKLGESSVLLRETTVVGVKTPITVKEDTIEYNADTYRVQPGAVVEDLLKRLPGVDVDASGKITANGKEVTKILVDGKEFFSDDPKVASKNLPVDMVDKLQVVDRKSDLARLTGVDDGEDETVINLTVKKGMKNGWFGTVEGGYGTGNRYQGGLNVNRFINGNQLTILGSANNTNNLGFTDAGGSKFRRFGSDQGVNTSQSVGINFNVGNGEIFRVGGNVLYSHSDRDTRKSQSRQYLLPDSTSWAQSGSDARDRGHNLRVDLRMQWKPDQYNTLDFRPSFSYTHNHSASVDSTLTLSGLLEPVNRSLNTSDSQGDAWTLGGDLTYNHNFKNHPGRSFSLNTRYNFSDTREKADTWSHNRFFMLGDSIDAYAQYADDHTWSNQLSARATWTEPLGDSSKGRFLTLSYQMNYRWNNADKLTYDADEATRVPGQQIDSLSNRFRNTFFSQDLRIGFKRVAQKFNLDVGVSLLPTMQRSDDLINADRNIPERWVWNFAPYLRYRYKMDKTRSFNLNYNGRSSQPSIAQLQPVADYSNPLRVVVGNPDLDPTFTHNLRLRFQDFNADAQRSVMLMLDAQLVQNSIVSRTDFNSATGGQTTTYANVNGVWSMRLMNMFSQPLRNKAWTFNNNIFANLNHTVGFNNGLRNNSMSFMLTESPSIAWRPANVELELRPRYSLQVTHNSLPSASSAVQPSTVHNYGGTFSGSYYTPIGLILATDLSYTGNSGYAAGYNRHEWMWNASVSYQFLRDNAATVSVKAYDMLNQRNNVSRSVTANYIDDTITNTLGRYVMVTFSYKFNSFGKGNEPQMRRDSRRGPDGDAPGAGGERPSGPPPGGAMPGPPPGM